MKNTPRPYAPNLDPLAWTLRRRGLLGLCALAILGAPAARVEAAPGSPRPGTPSVNEEKKIMLAGPLTWTAVSGQTGGFIDTLVSGGGPYGMVGMYWWENRDNPCQFKMSWRNFNNDEQMARDVMWKLAEFNRCVGSPGSKKFVSRAGKNEYISAAAVCLTDKRDSRDNKIKGIRLWGRILRRTNATWGPEGSPTEVRRTNCKQWSPKVSCPAGKIATKIRVYVNYKQGDSSRKYATGISLGCRGVIKR